MIKNVSFEKGFSTTIILVITTLIVLAAAFFLKNIDFNLMPKKSELSSNALPSAMPKKTVEWKKYQDAEGYYSFEYPADWIIDYKNEPVNLEDPRDRRDLQLSGPEGEITIAWTESYGGACPQGYEKLKLKDQSVDVCHVVDDPNDSGRESWNGIEKQLNKKTKLGVFINANASKVDPKNKDTILKIFSTLKLNEKSD